MTSGIIVTRAPYNEVWDIHVKKLDAHINTSVFKSYNDMLNDLVSNISANLPIDTGKLRAGFTQSFTLRQVGTTEIENTGSFRGAVNIENAADNYKIDFDMDLWFSIVPYARYHVAELITIDSYENPNVSGTGPLDLTIIQAYMDTQLFIFIKRAMISLGLSVI